MTRAYVCIKISEYTPWVSNMLTRNAKTNMYICAVWNCVCLVKLLYMQQSNFQYYILFSFLVKTSTISHDVAHLKQRRSVSHSIRRACHIYKENESRVTNVPPTQQRHIGGKNHYVNKIIQGYKTCVILN